MSGEVLGIEGGGEGETEGGTSSETNINKELAADVVGGIGTSVVVGRVGGREENAVEFSDISDDEVSILILRPSGAVG